MIYRQNRIVKQLLLPYLRTALADNQDQTFTQEHIKRIIYYARYTPVFGGDIYTLLNNSRLTQIQRETLTWLAAIAPVFDDFFDHTDLSYHTLKNLLYNPGTIQPKNDLEKHLLFFIQKVKKNIPDAAVFMQLVDRLFEAQIHARQLTLTSASNDELLQSSLAKGGYSTLLFRAAISTTISDLEMRAVYDWGGMTQWIDDLFDVYDDREAGIATAITRNTTFEAMAEDYDAAVVKLNQQFLQLGYPGRHFRIFWDCCLLLLVRGRVDIDYLLMLQKQQGGLFDPMKLSRNELICDMETWGNFRKSVGWFIRYCK